MSYFPVKTPIHSNLESDQANIIFILNFFVAPMVVFKSPMSHSGRLLA